MGQISEAEQFLLDQIRAGDQAAWSRFVERYRGRLLSFAQMKLPQRADAEDIVQDTFVGFITGLANCRGESSLETYLFTILRRKIINMYRSAHTRYVCLVQDVYRTSADEESGSNVYEFFASDETTASVYARRDEQSDLLRAALAAALQSLVDGYKKKLNFRDLEIIELLFYCQLANQTVAGIVARNEKNIAVFKHRCLKQVRELAARGGTPEPPDEGFEDLLTEVWEAGRMSCPKRSTIGAYLLETLDGAWHDYVGFHLNTLGCQFCRANLEDLRKQTAADESRHVQARIMESTVGFLHKPR
ncbi:MAG: sigma-70 family RNA polymerase sigma factor [Phycisphaerae bacterium]|nr:sigma-70 family RNA polymerase sigma factor [Phycisphaerae bacterium]